MKRTSIILGSLVILAIASPAVAQDDFDEPFEETTDEGTFEGGVEAEASAEVGGEATMTADAAAAGGAVSAGTIGIGGGITLSSLAGPQLEYHLDALLLEATLGLVFYSPSAEGADSVTGFGLGLGGHYALFERGPATLSIGGRLVFANNSGIDSTEIALEAPLRVQYYIGDKVSFHVETGLLIDIVGENGSVLPFVGAPGEGTLIQLGPSTLLGAAGFSFYFL